MNIDITTSFPPISEQALEEFEAEIGTLLPDDYRDFLLRYNGGEPSPRSFDVMTYVLLESVGIISFYGLHDGPYFSLRRHRALLLPVMPSSLLAIADVIYPNELLCLGLQGQRRGRIVYWDGNFGSDDDSDFSNVYPVAGTFSDFLTILYEGPDDT